jgi:C4-dicarboxylate-specific signal transduction histidine kinase
LNKEHEIADHKAILGKKFETSIENFVGEQICVEIVILKHQQEHGNQFVLFMRDLTEYKKLEDAATNSARLASLGVMASGIAHEINNPVAIIYGMAGLLGRGLNGEDIGQDKMRDMTTKIRTACNRILSIIRGIKAFAHNGDNDKFETISLAALIDESLEYMNEKFRSAAIQLKVDPVPEVSIECRRVQISQIIINLLGNAFDAVREQKPNWVHLDFQLMPDVLIIQVTDSGGGIPPEVEKKLFTPFFTTKGVGKGTGLGLSISMGILADHQGSLSLDRLCKNTRFVIKLPLRQSASLSDSEKKAA